MKLQHFLKVNCLSFFKKFQSLFGKCLSKNIWNFFSDFTRKKSNCFSTWWNRCWLFFFIVSIVQNRVIRLSKGLLRETYSIKEFTFKPKLSIKVLNWRLNYTWQGKNTLFILKYLMIFCILSKKLKHILQMSKKLKQF